MNTYYQMFPAAAAKRQLNGLLYVNATAEMYRRTDGQLHVRERSIDDYRMLYVSRVDNGIAYAVVGRAGDAIACVTNLPHSVMVEHTVDEPVTLQ